MSNSFFYTYFGDDGVTEYQIKMRDYTAAAQPTATAQLNASDYGEITIRESSRNRRVRARYVNLTRQVGTAPNLKILRSKFPLLKKGDYATLDSAGEITINGITWDVGDLVAQRGGK